MAQVWEPTPKKVPKVPKDEKQGGPALCIVRSTLLSYTFNQNPKVNYERQTNPIAAGGRPCRI